MAGAPAVVLPPLLTPQAFQEIEAFELCCGGRCLGTLETVRRPPVRFTGEGGYSGTEEFAWTAQAEQELADRLGKLLGRDLDAPPDGLE